ncbi:MAG TPA: selenoneine biosynthesis selenosugar synthase SenB [Methylibium sp.]|nr:selenoneine biosynthesis selenosugar synthase SenB [Methylibium sp.]
MRTKPRVVIVSPAAAADNNGNWHTAARWRRFLAPIAEVAVAQAWDGAPADLLIALHARKSAAAVERFRAADPQRPVALVLTGTDLYRDLDTDASARHAVECASRLVVLQPAALHRLDAGARAKATVIVQSAARRVRHDQARHTIDFVAVGHLRAEKDPLTLMAAVRALPPELPLRVLHIGAALDPALGEAARRTMADCPRYRWLGPLPQPAARRWIARAGALVHMSRLEGGANVVIEAVRSRVPVLASRIDGNLGLLGDGYEGYFAPGEPAALAALMERYCVDPALRARLTAQVGALEPGFAPAVEADRVRRLVIELLGGAAPRPGGTMGAPIAPKAAP